jgi:hypothetical protein
MCHAHYMSIGVSWRRVNNIDIYKAPHMQTSNFPLRNFFENVYFIVCTAKCKQYFLSRHLSYQRLQLASAPQYFMYIHHMYSDEMCAYWRNADFLVIFSCSAVHMPEHFPGWKAGHGSHVSLWIGLRVKENLYFFYVYTNKWNWFWQCVIEMINQAVMLKMEFGYVLTLIKIYLNRQFVLKTNFRSCQ